MSRDAAEWFPPEPEGSDRGSAVGHLRYEDIAQDGRVMLLAMPQSIGQAVWQPLIEKHAATRATMKSGIIPVLSRFVIEGTDAPLSVRRTVDFSGTYATYHSVDTSGAVDRLYVNMWTRVSGVRSRTYGTPPPGAGESALVGRIFAEHTLTRLFAPPGERKVLALPELEGQAAIPPARWQPRALTAMLVVPPGARTFDDDFVADDAAIAFGVAHTDSNQHVNSLVYPRVFEDAALRRFAARGQSTQVLARGLEIAYRKPFFAGERARVWLRGFVGESGRLGAIGYFSADGPAGAPPELAKAHAYVRMTFA
jgi:hypothetical protein